MSIQCAARFTLTLDLPGKKKPFITFLCEHPAHEGNEHSTSGTGHQGIKWTMRWVEKKIKKGGE